MSSTFDFKKIDYLEPFLAASTTTSSTTPAPRGTDVLSSCILREKNINDDSSANDDLAFAPEQDSLIVSFFSNGTLALKRIHQSSSSSSDFVTTPNTTGFESDEKENNNNKAMALRKLGQHKQVGNTNNNKNKNPSTLSWNDLSKEGCFSQQAINANTNNTIVGMTFNNGTCTIRSVIASHVDVAVVYPQYQEVEHFSGNDNNNNNRPSGQFVSNPDQFVDDFEQEYRQNRNQNDDGGDDDEAQNTGRTPKRVNRNNSNNLSTFSPAQEPQSNNTNNNITTTATFPLQPSQSMNAKTAEQNRDTLTGNSIVYDNNNNNQKQASSRLQQHRYVSVGAALCELSDGRCALFTVSTNVSNKTLLKGLLSSTSSQQQQDEIDAKKSSGSDSKQKQQQQQLPAYPIDAEVSILELPPNCISVQVQVSSSSILIRGYNDNNNNNNNSNNNNNGSQMLCLALDSSGRPIGAASLRGRCLGPFSSGMTGVRAMWRIHEDGTCSGNMSCGGGGSQTVLDHWVLGGDSGRENKNRKSASCSPLSNQFHQIIACAWLDHQILYKGLASSRKVSNLSPITNNVNTSFSCISVLLSQWKEHFVASPFTTNNNSNGNDKSASVVSERSVCTVLLSQMVAADPTDTLRGFTHRKICTFPTPYTLSASSNTSSLPSQTSASLSEDETLLAIASPMRNKNNNGASCNLVGVAIVIMTTRQDMADVNAEEEDDDEEDGQDSNPSAFLKPATSARVITFEVSCSHQYNNSNNNSNVAQSQIFFTSKKSVAVFFPRCGCCVSVPDVLRVSPKVFASPILGGGVSDSPLATLGLRNTEKFPVIPRLARFVPSSSPPQNKNNNNSLSSNNKKNLHQSLMNQTAFLEQIVQQNEAKNLKSSNHQYSSLSVFSSQQTPFVFFGLPVDVDSQSGSAATLVYACLTPKSGKRNNNNSNNGESTMTSFYNLLSSSSSSLESQQQQIRRLVDGIGAECMFLSYQFKNLDYQEIGYDNNDDDGDATTKTLLLQGGLSLIENYFSRANFILTVCANFFTKSQHQVHHFAAACVEMAKYTDRLLASFQDCFEISNIANENDDQENDAGANQNSQSAIAVLQSTKNNVNGNNMQKRREMNELEEALSHLVATTFTSSVSRLLHLGLISVASRVAHSLGPYCSFIVDLVYPSALQLYRQANISPGYASFLHDIENMVSDEGKDVVRSLEILRMNAMVAVKNGGRK